jgi:hypothetical protein
MAGVPKKKKQVADCSVLVLDHEAIKCAVMAAALARALEKHTELRKTNGDLKGVARLCATICGGATEVDQDWKLIRADQANYADGFLTTIYSKAGEGIKSLQSYATTLHNVRNNCMDKVQAIFDEASDANSGFIKNAEIGFHAARAVKITALGTLALLSGIGGVAGTAGATAFGVQFTGFGFVQGTLVTIGLKGSYNFTTSWMKEKTVDAIVMNGVAPTNNDVKDAVIQKTAEESLNQPLLAVFKKLAKSMGIEEKAQSKISSAQKKFDKLAKVAAKNKAQQLAAARAERVIAKQTAVVAKNAPKAAVGKAVAGGAKFASNAFPVIWLCKDLMSVYEEGEADLQML